MAKRVIVVGAGMVGLATAWHLQERGFEVQVLERREVAAGASWGNAGWLSPGLAIPLNEPSLVRSGILSMARPNSPLYVPPKLDLELWRFLAEFASKCTMRAWSRSMEAIVGLSEISLAAFDELSGSVGVPTYEAPIVAGFRKEAEAAGLIHEFDLIRKSGVKLETRELGPSARSEYPLLSGAVGFAVAIERQRYIEPAAYVNALAKAVVDRGGDLVISGTVFSVDRRKGQIELDAAHGTGYRADAAVLATGAWLNPLARQVGVREPVRAGRGYSMTYKTEEPPKSPVYFPAERIACTPTGSRLRVAGTMEFRRPDDPLDRRRVDSIVRSAESLLATVDWSTQEDVWVGPRPVSADGRALIGRTAMEGVYVAGGHGMWGVTLGPITGKLLAGVIDTGEVPAVLAPFNPLR